MSRFLKSARARRSAAGLAAGLAASIPLVATLSPPLLGVGLGLLAGLVLSLATKSAPGSAPEGTMTGAALGVPVWAMLHGVILPAFAGRAPILDPGSMKDLVPALIGWVVSGALAGAALHLLDSAARSWLGPVSLPEAPARTTPKRIVILGGGFAGITTARELERSLGFDASVSITLVSETNALLFTPMLAEVAGGSLEAPHISHPLRSALRRTEVVRGCVVAVDFETRKVRVDLGRHPTRELSYDEVVFALGSVSNFYKQANVERYALEFKSLGDAIRIRDRVIDLFERAATESDPERRRRLLTFVIAGGGFAGAELAGALNDFARGMLASFPEISANDVRVIVVHARDRILPELSEPLGRYARARMEARGVIFRMGAKVADCCPGCVVLSPPEEIACETLVWTAGTAPHPLLKSLPCERDGRGALVVQGTMAVKGREGVWALGDAASIPNGLDGKPCPPTAQFALREGRALARNLVARLRGRRLRPFRFRSQGALCVVGHHTACAELTVPLTGGRTVRFSGFFAWFLWRTIYLAKLPSLERRLRVMFDWTLELFFPRGLVRNGTERIESAREAAETPAEPAALRIEPTVGALQ